ncbi:unnamed protein product [Schistosoma margrebowiei]|uniref:Uncharacterized protein n=1 Tax=Schistosoma margrebowiei TaxID=48269 RepID=A0A183LS92_9TREM|nr:unnamed protein product [Schistosoma margrebowiei]
MESSRLKEERKSKEHITLRNGDRHEKNEQQLDGIRKEGPGQNGLENAECQFLSHTHEQMQMKIASVSAVSASVGLKIHKGKTKVLKFKAENSNPITLDGETLEEVECFTYLGSIIDEQGGSDADVKARIGKARAPFLQLKNI